MNVQFLQAILARADRHSEVVFDETRRLPVNSVELEKDAIVLKTRSHVAPPSTDRPPVAVLASSRDWSLAIVLYPSGPCLEMVEVYGTHARMVYSERLSNLDRIAEVLKEKQQ